MERKCAVCVYPWNSCETCCVTVGYWGVWPLEWGFDKTDEICPRITIGKYPHITFSSDGTGYQHKLTKEEVQKMIDETLKNGTTWKPEDFSQESMKTTGLSFEQALTSLKSGKRVTNAKWNGKNQYLFMMPGYKSVQANETLSKAAKISPGSNVAIAPYLMLRNSEGIFSNWVPSNGDLFSNEWEIIDDSDEYTKRCQKEMEMWSKWCTTVSGYQGNVNTSTSRRAPDGTTTNFT